MRLRHLHLIVPDGFAHPLPLPRIRRVPQAELGWHQPLLIRDRLRVVVTPLLRPVAALVGPFLALHSAARSLLSGLRITRHTLRVNINSIIFLLESLNSLLSFSHPSNLFSLFNLVFFFFLLSVEIQNKFRDGATKLLEEFIYCIGVECFR